MARTLLSEAKPVFPVGASQPHARRDACGTPRDVPMSGARPGSRPLHFQLRQRRRTGASAPTPELASALPLQRVSSLICSANISSRIYIFP